MSYKLTIEFTALEDAKAVQNYINCNYNDNEVLWNAISEFHEKRIQLLTIKNNQIMTKEEAIALAEKYSLQA